MAEKVLITRTGRTKIGIEAVAFGTLAGTMVDVYPDAGGLLDLKQEQLKMRDERPTKTAHQQNVLGQLSWGGKLGFKVRAPVAQLNAAATAVTPPQGLLPKALWGGEAKAAGSTVASSTTTAITVDVGHGARFAVGTWGAVVISGAPVPFKVIGVTGDVLDVYPTLPSAPSASAVVLNSVCYYPTQSNTQTLSVQHGKPNAANSSDYDQQWEARGGTGDLGFEMKIGQIPMLTSDLRGAPWTGPSSAPGLLPAPAAAETQGTPFVFNNATVLWQPVTTLTRVHQPIKGIDFKFDGQMMHLEDPGGTEGKIGVERVGSEFMMVSGSIQKRFDGVFDAYYAAGTPLWFCAMTPLGSGATMRWLIVEISTMFLSQKPGLADDGGMTRHQYEWEGLEDQTITAPATDLARAPFRMALI